MFWKIWFLSGQLDSQILVALHWLEVAQSPMCIEYYENILILFLDVFF